MNACIFSSSQLWGQVETQQIKNHNFRGRGFTIVEILVVVTIIGILAAAVAVNVIGYIGTSRQERARMDLASLKNAVELFYLQSHRYPTNDEGLEILTQTSTTSPAGLLSDVPIDPWGNTYEYRYPGQHGTFDIVCYGRDGVAGGEGEDADMGSWELNKSGKTNSQTPTQ